MKPARNPRASARAAIATLKRYFAAKARKRAKPTRCWGYYTAAGEFAGVESVRKRGDSSEWQTADGVKCYPVRGTFVPDLKG